MYILYNNNKKKMYLRSKICFVFINVKIKFNIKLLTNNYNVQLKIYTKSEKYYCTLFYAKL